MSTVLSQIADDILDLPPSDRAFLAHRLIQSLDDGADPDAEALWMEEIDRRSSEIKENRVACRPIDDVIANILRQQPSINLYFQIQPGNKYQKPAIHNQLSPA